MEIPANCKMVLKINDVLVCQPRMAEEESTHHVQEWLYMGMEWYDLSEPQPSKLHYLFSWSLLWCGV